MSVPRGARLMPWHVPALLNGFLTSDAPRYNVVPATGGVSPAIAAAVATVPGVLPAHRGVGAWVGGGLEGFGLVRVGAGHRRSTVVALTVRSGADVKPVAPVGPADQALAVCREVLAALSLQAAAQGRVRLVARLPDSSGFAGAFDQSGFSVAVRERIYQRRPGPASVPSGLDAVRPQEPADAWDVQQLYRAITPAAVQQAEAAVPGDWDASRFRRGRFGRAPRVDRYVADSDSGLEAWLELRVAPRGPHVIVLMLHPRAARLAGPLIDFAVWRLGEAPRRPIEIVVRDHDAVTAARLEAAGFQNIAGRLVMVKHLAVRVPAAAPDVALDRAPS